MKEDMGRNDFTEELQQFLRVRFGDCNINVNLFGAKLNIRTVEDDRFILYLRLWFPFKEGESWPPRTLVIAQIAFEETRAGHGQALLDFFVSKAQKYGYDKIAIESASENTGIQNFVRKYGFQQDRPASEFADANWIAPVSAVRDRLNSFMIS